MTDTITLPRSVVEQALEALFMYKPMVTGVTFQHGLEAMQALRAALEQPQDIAYHEAVSLAKWLFRKHFAHEEDYASGRVVWEPCDTTVGVISQIENMVCGLVRQQRQVKQEPFTVLVRKRSWFKNTWEAAPCGFPDYGKAWADERINVYTHPQAPRQSLTDAQINDHRLALAYDSEDLPDPWDFKQGVRAAERAHGIGGEK